MRLPRGYATIADPLASLQEYDTTLCGHCGKVIFVKPGTVSTVYLIPQRIGGFKEEPGAGCRVCMSSVCLPCHDRGTCTPLERKIAQMERPPVLVNGQR